MGDMEKSKGVINVKGEKIFFEMKGEFDLDLVEEIIIGEKSGEFLQNSIQEITPLPKSGIKRKRDEFEGGYFVE